MIGLLALVVLLPFNTPGATVREARRLQPGVTFVRVGDPITPAELAGATVVSYIDGPWRERPRTLGRLAGGRITIYTRPIRRVTGLRLFWYRRALGCVIAHEVEHLRRGSAQHDPSGWFAETLDERELLR